MFSTFFRECGLPRLRTILDCGLSRCVFADYLIRDCALRQCGSGHVFAISWTFFRLRNSAISDAECEIAHFVRIVKLDLYFCPRTARAGVPFSISQSGEDAVPPDTAEKRHSLPLQACPDRLTVKAFRPGLFVVNPSASTHFCPRLYIPGDRKWMLQK